MIYLELFLGFLLVGCFSFGGAYGAIPLIREVVMHYGWLTEEKFTYFVAVSESTPGPIMVNLATYVGSSQGGILGAAIATISVVTPSFLIILLVVTILSKVLENLAIRMDTFEMDIVAAIITILLLVISTCYKKLRKKNFSPIMLILTAAVLGMLMY